MKARSTQTILLVGLFLVCGAAVGFSAEGSKIYWTELTGDVVKRANLDGSDVEVVVSGATGAAILAVDARSETVAWGSFVNDLNRRRLCDDSDLPPATLLRTKERLTIDDRTGELYATGALSSLDRGVFRSDADGSNVVRLVSTGTTSTRGVAGDFDGGYLYYAADDGVIGQVDLATNESTVILSGMGNPNGIAVDTVNGHIYFSRTDGDRSLHRSNLDGSGLITLVTGSDAFATSIALDLSNDTIYWANPILSAIFRADLDGSNVVPLVDGLDLPISIAILHDYRRGTVNSGAGRIHDVLRVNGSEGWGNDIPRVSVGVDEEVTISLDAAPAGPQTGAAYTLFVWAGDTTNAQPLYAGSSVVGTVANPTPMHPFESPQALYAARGGLPPRFTFGIHELTSPATAPWSMTKARFANPGTYILQAVIEDAGACNMHGFSTTNTILLLVE